MFPWIIQWRILHVRAVPRRQVGDVRSQRLQAFFGRRIPAVVYFKRIERELEVGDLLDRRRVLCLLRSAGELRHDDRGQNDQNHHHEQQLDERKCISCSTGFQLVPSCATCDARHGLKTRATDE